MTRIAGWGGAPIESRPAGGQVEGHHHKAKKAATSPKYPKDENNLLCYMIRGASGEPKHKKVDGIKTVNEFSSDNIRTKNVKELCVPSVKTIIEPQ